MPFLADSTVFIDILMNFYESLWGLKCCKPLELPCLVVTWRHKVSVLLWQIQTFMHRNTQTLDLENLAARSNAPKSNHKTVLYDLLKENLIIR